MTEFRWKETKPEVPQTFLENVIIRFTDTHEGEVIEVYNEKGRILTGKQPRNPKEAAEYLTFLQTRYPRATIEKRNIFDVEVDDCVSEPIELYTFFPKQLSYLIEKNIYDLYNRWIPVSICYQLAEGYYPVSFEFSEDLEPEDKAVIQQIFHDYKVEIWDMSALFEAFIKDITGKSVHKLEIDESFTYQRDPNDWLDEGRYARDYEARLFVYVK